MGNHLQSKRKKYVNQCGIFLTDEEVKLLANLQIHYRGTKSQVFRMALAQLSKDMEAQK